MGWVGGILSMGGGVGVRGCVDVGVRGSEREGVRRGV